MIRDWINLLNESAEPIEEQEDITELTEDDLMERSMKGVEITKNGTTSTIDVLENPSRAQLMRLYSKQNNGWFRGFLTTDNKVYIFDAYVATHYDVGVVTGIGGQRFEIRGTTAEPMSMLYLPQNAGPGSEWRANPLISRMFDKPDYHIGRLRW